MSTKDILLILSLAVALGSTWNYISIYTSFNRLCVNIDNEMSGEDKRKLLRNLKTLEKYNKLAHNRNKEIKNTRSFLNEVDKMIASTMENYCNGVNITGSVFNIILELLNEKNIEELYKFFDKNDDTINEIFNLFDKTNTMWEEFNNGNKDRGSTKDTQV